MTGRAEIFANARLVLADEVVDGCLAVADRRISTVDAGATNAAGLDFEGDYLVPGLVELHTDHLENHYRPRPGVYWNPMAALQAHDAQVAASGITTVLDAVRLGTDADEGYNLGEHIGILMDAISRARTGQRLRADHHVHLRCELATADALDHFREWHRAAPVRLASLMDHTPGQRQFVSLDLYYAYYQGKTGRTDEQMQRFIAARMADQDAYSQSNRQGIVEMAHGAGLVLASHDDATAAHIAEAQSHGIAIAEFPTTRAAAVAARAAGLSILMGAPNVVRGGSHSGNISAVELAADGLLDILSSDYVPFALMQAAFMLPEAVPGHSLPGAVAMVSKNPAQAAGFADRGEIAPGLAADFARVSMRDGVPIVRAVWRAGERII